MQIPFENPQLDLEQLPQIEALSFQGISIKYRTQALLTLLFWFVVLFSGCMIWYFVADGGLISVIVAVFLILYSCFQFFFIWKKQEKYGYALREKDIAFTRGYVIQKTTVIPFNRIQHVSTGQGILERFFTISTLHIFTAGGSGSDITIPGLEPALAQQIKEAIVQKVDNAGH